MTVGGRQGGPSPDPPLVRAVAAELTRFVGEPLAPALYLVATPIGNLGDITLRALAVLQRADRIYCEDTRHSRRLLERYAITRPLGAYHEYNASVERPRILAAIADGARVALVSDAGTPLVSDPGFKLVRAAVEAGFAVTCLPGASAVLAGLTLSGLPCESFHFAGFLPPKDGERRRRLEVLRQVPGTLVLFEAPGRVAATVRTMAQVLGERPAAVARELTKLHEEVVRGGLGELAARLQDVEPRGEYVILVGPGVATAVGEDDVRAALRAAMTDRPLRSAVDEVATGLGIARKRVYELALALKRDATP